MRIVKLAIISLVVFGIMIFTFSLFIPSDVRISRAINVAVPKDSLYRYIADIRTWKNWNDMLTQQDSSLGNFTENSYAGKTMKVDLLMATPDSVRTRWQTGSSDAIKSGFNLVQSLSDTTVAQWYFDFHLQWYPWEKFGSIIFDQQLGPAMESSLRKLKDEMEGTISEPNPPPQRF
jgi:hypothetical protein